MQPADLKSVAAVERAAYQYPWSLGIFRDCLLAGYYCLVLDVGGSVTGYGIMSVAAGEAHLLNLCVHPNAQRLGYGRRLLNALMLRAADAGADVLDLGMIGTEMLYHAVGELELEGGIVVTASHNPKEYSGMKIVRGGALPVGGDSGLDDVRRAA